MIGKILLAISMGAFGLFAAQQPETTPSNAQSTQATQATPATGADSDFIMNAAQANNAEISLSQIALQKSSSDEVKKFAQQMIDDHQKMNDQLRDIASKKNINLPSDLEQEHKALSDRLSSLSGIEFDREYMKNAVEEHSKVASLFESEAQSGQDPDVKNWASQQLPQLQKHQEMAHAMMTNMEATPSQQARTDADTTPSSTTPPQSAPEATQTQTDRSQAQTQVTPDPQSSTRSDTSATQPSTMQSDTSAAQSSQPGSQTETRTAGDDALPRTASPLPLIALVGLISLVGGLAVRMFTIRMGSAGSRN